MASHAPAAGQPEGVEDEDAMEGRLGSYFASQPVVSNAQVAILLSQYVDSKKTISGDFVPHPMVAKTLEYVQRFNSAKNAEMATEVLSLLKQHGLSEFESGCMANLMPEQSEEARALVPTLGMDTDCHPAFSDEEVQEILDQLIRYKRFE